MLRSTLIPSVKEHVHAIRQVKPYAVDVSGGVELDKGIKDHKKVADFIRQVRAADNEENT